jgi:hypothetical protein
MIICALDHMSRTSRMRGKYGLREHRLPDMLPNAIGVFNEEFSMKSIVHAAIAGMLFLAMALLPSTAEAQAAGRYAVEGQNPDGSRYAGTATIEKTGQTFRVTWVIEGARFVGTGIGNDEAIAITYRAGNETGIALLGQETFGYGLVWAYAGGTTLGLERWTRR